VYPILAQVAKKTIDTYFQLLRALTSEVVDFDDGSSGFARRADILPILGLLAYRGLDDALRLTG